MSSSSGVATSVSELLYPCYFTCYLVWPVLVVYGTSLLMSGACASVQYTVGLLESLVLRRTAPTETYKKLDVIAASLVEQLRLSAKQVAL